MIRCHASSVEIDGRGVLLRGPSGAGKSDLALRLIDGGARLIADDYTEIHIRGGRAYLTSPEAISGRLEVRGLGLMRFDPVSDIPLALVFDLVPWDRIDRVPEADIVMFENAAAPRRLIDPFTASAPAIIRLAVRQDPLLTGYE